MTVSVYHSGGSFAGAHFVYDRKADIPALLAQIKLAVGTNTVQAILLIGVMGTWSGGDDDYIPASLPSTVITALGLQTEDEYHKVYKINTPGESERVRCAAAGHRITVSIATKTGAGYGAYENKTAEAEALGQALVPSTPALDSLTVTT